MLLKEQNEIIDFLMEQNRELRNKVAELTSKIDELNQKIEELTEQKNKNSKNSSKPR